MFLRLNIPPNLIGCMSSCNYALIFFLTFGFIVGLHMMMVYNSKSFHILKCMSGNNFSHGWFLCDNHKCNKCWFLCKQHLLVLFLYFFSSCCNTSNLCIRNDKPSMYIRNPFFHIMNHVNIYSIVWERHVY